MNIWPPSAPLGDRAPAATIALGCQRRGGQGGGGGGVTKECGRGSGEGGGGGGGGVADTGDPGEN